MLPVEIRTRSQNPSRRNAGRSLLRISSFSCRRLSAPSLSAWVIGVSTSPAMSRPPDDVIRYARIRLSWRITPRNRIPQSAFWRGAEWTGSFTGPRPSRDRSCEISASRVVDNMVNGSHRSRSTRPHMCVEPNRALLTPTPWRIHSPRRVPCVGWMCCRPPRRP